MKHISQCMNLKHSFVSPQIHDASDSNEEKTRIYRALGSGKTDALTTKCLDLVFSVSYCLQGKLLGGGGEGALCIYLEKKIAV